LQKISYKFWGNNIMRQFLEANIQSLEDNPSIDLLVNLIQSLNINPTMLVELINTAHLNGNLPRSDIDLQRLQYGPQPKHYHYQYNIDDINEENKIPLENFMRALACVMIKIYEHDNFQTYGKLGFGAAGWVTGGIIAAQYTEALWLIALAQGFGASVFLIPAMLLTQTINWYFDQGRSPKELLSTSGELLGSVTEADMLWQPLTNLAVSLATKIAGSATGQAYPLTMICLIILYTVESGAFGLGQTLLAKAITKLNLRPEGQVEFTPDSDFLAKVAGAYSGFNFGPELFKIILNKMGLGVLAEGPIAEAVLSGIGTATLPALFGFMNKGQALDQLKEIYTKLIAPVRKAEEPPVIIVDSHEAPDRATTLEGANPSTAPDNDAITPAAPQHLTTRTSAPPRTDDECRLTENRDFTSSPPLSELESDAALRETAIPRGLPYAKVSPDDIIPPQAKESSVGWALRQGSTYLLYKPLELAGRGMAAATQAVTICLD
jgi:hypothetical protein